MNIHDVSVPISPATPVWPGDPAIVLEKVSSMDAGAHDNVSRLACGVHTGTHVDAPHHFLNNHRTVESLALDILVGPVQVVEIPPDAKVVNAEVLESALLPPGLERLLLKTGNSQLWKQDESSFHQDFVGISADGADWLVRYGIKLVGIDYLSVAPFHQSVPTHVALLTAGIIIVEGLDLSAIKPGSYNLCCLPLKLVGSDGAPARVILVD
ncbi:MAG: cyclase family protein [Anaerolineales bacterium]|jgi:arylformamidase